VYNYFFKIKKYVIIYKDVTIILKDNNYNIIIFEG